MAIPHTMLVGVTRQTEITEGARVGVAIDLGNQGQANPCRLPRNSKRCIFLLRTSSAKLAKSLRAPFRRRCTCRSTSLRSSPVCHDPLECGGCSWRSGSAATVGGAGETLPQLLVSPLCVCPAARLWPGGCPGCYAGVLRAITAEELPRTSRQGQRKVPVVSFAHTQPFPGG